MSETPETPGAPPPPPPSSPPPASPPPPPPSGGAGGSTPTPSQNTPMLVLSYLWLLALIPLLVEKNDREVQWHAKHGLVLFAAEFIVFIAITILGMILDAIVGGLGCLTSILSLLVWLGVLVLHVVCIVKAVGGKRLIIPGVSQYADRF